MGIYTSTTECSLSEWTGSVKCIFFLKLGSVDKYIFRNYICYNLFTDLSSSIYLVNG